MLALRRCVWCGAGRGAGMRATEGRFFTERRRAGRTIGVGAVAFFGAALCTAFLMIFLREGLPLFGAPLRALSRALWRFAGALPLRVPGFLPLAISRFPLPVRCGGTVYFCDETSKDMGGVVGARLAAICCKCAELARQTGPYRRAADGGQ